MNEKLNLVETLKGCPKGTKLYSSIYGEVELMNVLQGEDVEYPIEIKLNNNIVETFTNGGRLLVDYDGECTLFPSREQRDWSKFKHTCEFKDGDIIFTHANCLKVGVGNTWISIFKERRNGGVATYVDYAEDGSDYYSDLDGDKALLCMESDILRQRFATEEEKKKLFQAIKDNGYKWNAETKTLEKLIKPKFDPNTLQVFDKVLVRLTKDGVWHATLFSHYDKEVKWGCYPFVTTSSKSYDKCIPYNDDTKHIVGTTKEAPEYYRYWED